MAFNAGALPAQGYMRTPMIHNGDGTGKNTDAAFRQIMEDEIHNAITASEGKTVEEMKEEDARKLTELFPDGAVIASVNNESFAPGELFREYRFVPASEGAPPGADPFTIYYDENANGEYANFQHPPVIPVFSKFARTPVGSPDGALRLTGGPVLGYFVKKDFSVDFSITKIAVKGEINLEKIESEIFDTLLDSHDGDDEENFFTPRKAPVHPRDR